MKETNGKKTRTLRAFARKTLGSSGTRSHTARAAMLSMALGVTATVSAAPSVKVLASAPTKATVATAQKPAKRHWYQIGKASWYGGGFNGRKTANGETFNTYDLTCAHRTLPLGSYIRVTNLANNKSTLVRVNDRGPMVPNVVLDLSRAAAQKLGFDGLAKVKIETVSTPDARIEMAQLEMPHAMASGQ